MSFWLGSSAAVATPATSKKKGDKIFMIFSPYAVCSHLVKPSFDEQNGIDLVGQKEHDANI
jgi:hypothetical protein